MPWAPSRPSRSAGGCCATTFTTARAERDSLRNTLRESTRNTLALLAFFALSNADIVVARNVLDSHDAGLYAGGLILTKAVLFLPQFVVVVAFPAMSTPSERRRALIGSLGLVAGPRRARGPRRAGCCPTSR